MFLKLRQFISAWLAPCDQKARAVAGCCLVLALGAVWYLIVADAPWDEKIQKKIAEGAKLKPQEYGVIGLWWGTLGALGIALATLGTVRWWGRAAVLSGADAGNVSALPELGCRMRWLLPVGIAVAVVLGGFLRAPRLDHSLWNDEEYAVRRNVWGEWKTGDDGGMHFDELDWEDALFFNHGNNHLFHTVSARVALDIWQNVNGWDEDVFSEAAVRFFPFLAGLGSIAALGVLGWACGIPLSGLAGAFLLALSPWHMRYSVEARGYSSMIFFVILALVALIAAIRTGRWRWWFCYGAAQCAYFLCFTGALYVVVAQNLFVAVHLFLGGGARRWMVPRWLVASLLTSIPFILLMVPSVSQIIAYLERPDLPRIPMGMGWIWDFWSHLVGGIPYKDQSVVGASPLLGGEEVRHLGTSLVDEARERGWILPAVRIFLPVLFGFGIVAMLVKGWPTRMIVVALGFSAILFFAHNALAENLAHVWYLVHAMPLFALAVPAGVEIVLGNRWRWSAGFLVLVVMIYCFLAVPGIWRIRDLDRQPMRQTITKIQELASPEIPLTGVFGTSDRQVKSFDPGARILKEAGDVDHLLAEGAELGRPVFIYYCGDVVSWMKRREVAERIASDPGFRSVALIIGLEAMYTYRVFRYVP